MPKLLYQGHGSFRLTVNGGRVIFVDPFVGGSYETPADIILVTHGHRDHSNIELCAQMPNCRIITHKEALAGGKHNNFDVGGIKIQAVEASNKNHNPKECVGYIITLDGVKIYASGDTSKTEAMKSFAALKLDYALFCGDGFYNMDISEAAECAVLVGARNNIIIHTVPNAAAFFDRVKAEAWTAPNKLILEPGQEIELC